MAIYKVGIPISVKFTPPKFQTGLTDCKLEVYDETGVEIVGSPFTMVELTDGAPTPTSLGIYSYSFTPNAQGDWMVVSESLSKGGRSAKIYKIEGVDVDDLAKTTEVTAVETKVDMVDATADAIKIKTDALPSDPADQSLVEAAITGAQNNINANVDVVEVKVDAVDAELDTIKGTGYDPNADSLKKIRETLDTLEGGGKIL